MTAKGQISTLQGMELGRTRLDSHTFGNYSPPFALIGLIDPYNLLDRFLCPLSQLQAHERIGRFPDAADNGAYLQLGNAELGAQFCGKAVDVRPGLYIEIVKESVKCASGHS